jgi:phosphoglycolate phosphatase
MSPPKLILFDIDGTLIDTGGAGARSWAWAFERLFGRRVDIAEHSTAGMTDPAIGRTTFKQVMEREPTSAELTRLMASYQAVLPDFVASSEDYQVLDGVQSLLEDLTDAGVALGLTTGGLEAAAHTKLGRGQPNHFFLVGGYGSDSEDGVRSRGPQWSGGSGCSATRSISERCLWWVTRPSTSPPRRESGQCL